jgi:hypothetical protein
MTPISNLNTLDWLILVAENRLDTDFTQKEARGARFQVPLLEQSLADGDWKPLIKNLWSDEQGALALGWLRQKENEFLPPLLYEQSIQEFLQKPTLNTACTRSIPLIVSATLSLKQQESLIQEKALLNPSLYEVLDTKYLEKLNELIGRSHKTSIPEIVLTSDCISHIFERVHQLSEKKWAMDPKALSWLIVHPLKEESFHPVETWPELGDAVIKNWIQDWTVGTDSLKFFQQS